MVSRSATTRWWWIRHAPVLNHGGRIYGRNDVDADTSDVEALRAVAERLPAKPVWLTTPLRRTGQTLSALLAAGGRPPAPPDLIEPDLMEQNFGQWQGLTHDEVQRLRGAEAHRFWVSPATERPQDGESFTDVVARVAPALHRLSENHAGRDIVAVAHGGTIRAALAVALELPPEAALRFCVGNLFLTRIDHIATATAALWRIESVNGAPQPPAGSALTKSSTVRQISAMS